MRVRAPKEYVVGTATATQVILPCRVYGLRQKPRTSGDRAHYRCVLSDAYVPWSQLILSMMIDNDG